MPDDLFARVDAAARELGVSRSEFLARAARRQLEHLDRDGLVEQVNQAYAAEGAAGRAEEQELVGYSMRRLSSGSGQEAWE
jgi:predicted ArsR family transcriptional regulator